jgi:hypothetical protein
MAIRHFAKIDKETNQVLKVTVKNDSKTNWNAFESNTDYIWKETFPDAEPGIASYRYNYAGVGGTYYADADAFIPKYPGIGTSRVLNTTTYQWDPSAPRPTTLPNLYEWDDEYCQWLTMISPGNAGGFENSDLLSEITLPGNDIDNMNKYIGEQYAPDGTFIKLVID